MTFLSLFQPHFLFAVALFALVFGTFSGSEMTEVEEERFVCLACQARHFPAIFSSRRDLRIHMKKSKNPMCALEWSKIRVMTRPARSRRCYSWWIGGNGTLLSSATPVTGCAENTLNIVCICMVCVMYMYGICNVYVMYTYGICNVYV